MSHSTILDGGYGPRVSFLLLLDLHSLSADPEPSESHM